MMPHCPRCGAFYYPNAIFCEACGANLYGNAAAGDSQTSSPADQSAPLEAVILSIPTVQAEIRLSVGQLPVHIGRHDMAQRIFPDVDLTDYGAAEAGVSRQHALLTVQQNRVLIEDLASTNGTWVNDSRLAPNRPYVLKNGDILRLGRLRLRVRFVAAGADEAKESSYPMP